MRWPKRKLSRHNQVSARIQEQNLVSSYRLPLNPIPKSSVEATVLNSWIWHDSKAHVDSLNHELDQSAEDVQTKGSLDLPSNGQARLRGRTQSGCRPL